MLIADVGAYGQWLSDIFSLPGDIERIPLTGFMSAFKAFDELIWNNTNLTV